MKIFRQFLVKIFILIFLQKLTWFPKNSGLPGGLLYVCYGVLVKILNFTTAKPGRIPHFQIWSKTAKFAKKPQKWHFLAVLSTLSQILAKIYFFSDFEPIPSKKSHFFWLFKIIALSLQNRDQSQIRALSGPFGPRKLGLDQFLWSKNYFLVISKFLRFWPKKCTWNI